MIRAGVLAFSLLLAGPAHALDKQGSAHGGTTEAEETGFDVSGNVFFGTSLYNPTYAARPDNSGLALLRFGAHADVDLIGHRLSIPLDVNFFTDRERRGAGIFVPSEGDVIGGVTTTWPLGDGAIELGVRGEHDAPLDRGGFSQSFVDARARYLYSLAEAFGLDASRAPEDLRGWLTLGCFAFNPTYAARPDNSGRAFLRYAAHAESVFWTGRFSFALDATSFTDRVTNAFRPSELDLTFDAIVRFAPMELHLAYERDMPVDRSGLVQHFLYTLAAFAFDLGGSSRSGQR